MSEWVQTHHECRHCGSSDAASTNDRGWAHCFSCGKDWKAEGSSSMSDAQSSGDETPAFTGGSGGFLTGDFQALPKRRIDLETTRKFGYRVGRDRGGRTVQIADYRDADGVLVAQKVRGADKSFSVVGNGRDMPLFGQHLWKQGGKRIVVVEGEIDALSVGQVTGLTWPVVSLPNGAQSAKKAIQRSLEWLSSFDQVVLAFDMDEPGRAAAAECSQLFQPGKCAIAELPLKDANEMLQAGKVKELSNALWQARVYRPDGIVSLDEIEDRVLAAPERGRSYPFEGVDRATFGRRPGEVIGLGGGSGCGKTDLFTTLITHDLMTLGLTVGVIYLEQSVGETGKRIAGKVAGKRFWVPDGSWSEAELRDTWKVLKDTQRLYLYDAFGSMDWETVKSRMRYMATSLGCHHIYLDHLTALAAAADDERTMLEKIMAELSGMAQELGVVIHFVSHLATPEGKPHEEGGRVQARHFKGSRAIIFWSHVLFGLERDTQTPEAPTVLRCLKHRQIGEANGKTWGIRYDCSTGLLSECGLHEFEDNEKEF